MTYDYDIHAHPCDDCGGPVACDGRLDRNHDGEPATICTAYHLPGGATRPTACAACKRPKFRGRLHIRFTADDEDDALDLLQRMARAVEQADLTDVEIDVDEDDLEEMSR